MRANGDARPEWDSVLPDLARDDVGLSLRLRRQLDPELEARIEATGARLRRDPTGRPWRLGRLCAVSAPWDAVPELAGIGEVERIELARPPGLVPHLDVSVPEIGADRAWAREDQLGLSLDGAGVVIADFDSGIDVFHPLFFQLDGGTYQWLDANGNGRFDPGVDTVDLNGDGRQGRGEDLALLEGALVQNGYGWLDGFYDADIDWLYNDANGNGLRDYGPEAGYTDLDPSFGEMLFVANDTNGNGLLDPDEWLIGLGSSKVIATLVEPGTIRYRGVNLIETPVADPEWERSNGTDTRADHGTGVSSILVGGWSGLGRRITGVAPGAELILVDFNNDLGLVVTLPWVISLGARASSHPYGHKAFSFLDGSSNDELAIDLAYEEEGAIQAISVGNEAGNHDDASITVPAGGSVRVPFAITHYTWASPQLSLAALSLRWRRPEVGLSFTLVDPEGRRAELGAGSGTTRLEDVQIQHGREDSPRGTAKLDLMFYRNTDLPQGEWAVEISNPDGEPVTVVGTIINNVFRGGLGTSFIDETQIDPFATVSAYATADRAIGACSYGTRHSLSREVIGEISGFSSRGPRIDGFRIVDICAPGDNDIIWAQASRHGLPLGGYSYGGGTSASAPHVAGTIALLQQAAPWASASQIEDALLGGALVDELVGDEVPNHTWGFGKLRVMSALELLPPRGTDDQLEVDRTPWIDDHTPDAGLPRPAAASDPLVGVEGGGCHCHATGIGGFEGLRRLLSHL
jgi:subtilisin family serine protease